jgi:hypothetical protein
MLSKIIINIPIWMARFVYFGILLSGLYFYDKFYGEYNLKETPTPELLQLVLSGWLFLELGIWIGRLFVRRNHINRASPLIAESSFLQIFFLWICFLAMSIKSFIVFGVPLLTDPMNRGYFGIEHGILKRALTVMFPLSTLELFLITFNRRMFFTAFTFVITTAVVLLMLSFKSFIFFFLIAIVILIYREKKRLVFNIFSFAALCVLVAFILLYGKFGLSEEENPLEVMIVRITNMLSKSPLYIINNRDNLVSKEDLIENEKNALLKTLRLSPDKEIRFLDAEISSTILERNVDCGGLNPTAIGYGYLMAEEKGVFAISFIYGILLSVFTNLYNKTKNSLYFTVYLYAAFAVCFAIQAFSPVWAFLDMGLSIMLYYFIRKTLIFLRKNSLCP